MFDDSFNGQSFGKQTRYISSILYVMVMKILLSKGMKYFVFDMDMEELVSFDAIKCSCLVNQRMNGGKRVICCLDWQEEAEVFRGTLTRVDMLRNWNILNQLEQTDYIFLALCLEAVF